MDRDDKEIIEIKESDLPKDIEIKRTELTPDIKELVTKIKNIFTELPLVYKRYALSADFVLMIAGVKACTDLSLPGNTYDEEEFNRFCECFGKYGYQVSELQIEPLRDGSPRRIGYIYDPQLLEDETKQTALAPPYKGEELQKYLAEAEKAGFDMPGVYGKLYSFPDSAIHDYLDYEHGKKGNRKAIHNGNETYWYYPPMREDVVARETLKTQIFNELQETPQYRELINGPDLQQSDILWNQRLPESIRRK